MRSVRKTLGAYPGTSLQEARMEAVNFIQQVKSGSLCEAKKLVSLESLFVRYTQGWIAYCA